MKTIDTYIKEALLTKSNIEDARKANIPFPEVDFDEPDEDDAKEIEKWIKDNGLEPDFHLTTSDKNEPSGHWGVEPGVGRPVHYMFCYIFDKVQKYPISFVDIGPNYVHRVGPKFQNGESSAGDKIDNIVKTIKAERGIR